MQTPTTCNQTGNFSPLTVVEPEEAPTPEEGAPIYYLAKFFDEKCMKMKEIEPTNEKHRRQMQKTSQLDANKDTVK